jgi:hypothetical protein
MGHVLAELFGLSLYFGSIAGLAYFAWQVNPLAAVVGVVVFVIGLLVLGVVNQLNRIEAARNMLELEAKEVKP